MRRATWAAELLRQRAEASEATLRSAAAAAATAAHARASSGKRGRGGGAPASNPSVASADPTARASLPAVPAVPAERSSEEEALFLAATIRRPPSCDPAAARSTDQQGGGGGGRPSGRGDALARGAASGAGGPGESSLQPWTQAAPLVLSVPSGLAVYVVVHKSQRIDWARASPIDMCQPFRCWGLISLQQAKLRTPSKHAVVRCIITGISWTPRSPPLPCGSRPCR